MMAYFVRQYILILLITLSALWGGYWLGEQNSPRRAQVAGEISTNPQSSGLTEIIETALPSVVTVAIQAGNTPAGIITQNQNIGSGFFVSDNGLLVTNKHVVGIDEATYIVILDNGQEYPVENIYQDQLNDLAIIKISAGEGQPLPLGDSDTVQLGETAIAIGTSLGSFTNTVTSGIISGKGRGIVAGSPFENYIEELDNVIQTDAAINPGNSGGPLLNGFGEVIGVNTAVLIGGENLGFAIPVNEVKRLIETFEAQGSSFDRPYIGIRYQFLDETISEARNAVAGAYVIEVIEGSPAKTAGLENNDVIQKAEGKEISDRDVLNQVILDRGIGQALRLEVWRAGEIRQIEVEIGKAP